MAFKPGDELPPGAKRRPFLHRVARPSVYATDAEALKSRTLVQGGGLFPLQLHSLIAWHQYVDIRKEVSY